MIASKYRSCFAWMFRRFPSGVDLIVFFAYLTNNRGGKSVDAFGRSYREVYRKFGHEAMVKEYLKDNSWNVKR